MNSMDGFPPNPHPTVGAQKVIDVHIATLRGLLTGLDKPDHYMHALAEIEAEITRLRAELEAPTVGAQHAVPAQDNVPAQPPA